jgi:UDP-N-acetylmuramoyl-tripeptide--D-alanyl-D-alanine ligase
MTAANVVAVAGSAGKTSTKDLIFSSVSRGFKSHSNSASFNNEFGLPVTVLDAPLATEVLVLEMGERFSGDLRYLCDIAAPDIGVITHVGLAHAGNLGGREGIIDVFSELLESLPDNGIALLNSECSATPILRERSAARVLTTGIAEDADIRISNVSLDDELRPTFSLQTPWGDLDRVRLNLLGEHQIPNAAMAAVVALHIGASIEDISLGLTETRAAHWRMELSHTDSGIAVLNDSYNASPKAMEAALKSFSHLRARRRIAVLGAMHELGNESSAQHARIGKLAAAIGLDELVVIESELSEPLAAAAEESGLRVSRVQGPEEAFAFISQTLESGDAVLLKASRVVGLERVAELLLGVAG